MPSARPHGRLGPRDTTINEATASIADLEDHTGLYALTPPRDLTDLILVRRSRSTRQRYAVTLTPGDRAITHGDYLGARPLASLSPGDRVPDARALRLLARHGPYDTCLMCQRPVPSEAHLSLGLMTPTEYAAQVAEHGPPPDDHPLYNNPATSSDLLRVFGVGSSCARKHLHMRARTLQTLFRAEVACPVVTPPRWVRAS